MKRKVEIRSISREGVSLRVTFHEAGWMINWFDRTVYDLTRTTEDALVVTSPYFRSTDEAKKWVGQLTDKILEIKRKREQLAKTFEEFVGEEETG